MTSAEEAFDPSSTSGAAHQGDNAGYISYDAPPFFKPPHARVRRAPPPAAEDHPNPFRGKDACISMDSPEYFKIAGVPKHAHYKAGHRYTFSESIGKWKQPHNLPAKYMIDKEAPEWETVKRGKLYGTDTNQWNCSWKSAPNGLGRTGTHTDEWTKTLNSPWKGGSFDELPKIEYQITPTKPFRSSPKLKLSGAGQTAKRPPMESLGNATMISLMEGGKSMYQQGHGSTIPSYYQQDKLRGNSSRQIQNKQTRFKL